MLREFAKKIGASKSDYGGLKKQDDARLKSSDSSTNSASPYQSLSEISKQTRRSKEILRNKLNTSTDPPSQTSYIYSVSHHFAENMGNSASLTKSEKTIVAAEPLSPLTPTTAEFVPVNGSVYNMMEPMRPSGTTAFQLEQTNQFREIINELQQKLEMKELKNQELLEKLSQSRTIIIEKDDVIIKLKQEIDKLKSVLQATVHEGQKDMLTTIHEDVNKVSGTESRKQGVSGESSSHARSHMQGEAPLEKFDKDFRSKQLIKEAILENDFLKQLDSLQIREIVDCVYEKNFDAGEYVIKEGETGQYLFVCAEGEMEVWRGEEMIGSIMPGRVFGELAILYNCLRTASVKAIIDSKVWVLDRPVFQIIMMKTNMQRQLETLKMLKSVPLLGYVSHDKLAKIADALLVDFFHEGEHILREGTTGDTFYMIYNGTVQVTKTPETGGIPIEVRSLTRGDYFGEKALLKEDKRTANVIALPPGVECLTLDRDNFLSLIGGIEEIRTKEYNEEVLSRRSEGRSSSERSTSSPIRAIKCDPEYAHIELNHLEVIATLGMGGFGRVELVQLNTDRSQSYALKCLKKQHIIDTHQQEHIYSEKEIMMTVRTPFICRLFKTFRDRKYLYMLLEVCLGGEVWAILRDRGQFDESTSRFYIGCVIEAFEYLHSRGIIYRDLKPENMLLDARGYSKLVDFGFAKKIGIGKKTWTFCGTPEYVAPEIILNRGHDFAVDYWSIGILMFELLNGNPPFAGSDPMKTYNLILRGIDVIEFPKRIGRNGQNLIRKLCRENPTDRLGYQRLGIVDIKKHKWFSGFDWEGLRKQTLKPPIIPCIKSPIDFSNFDDYPRDMDVPPDEMSGWDAEF